MNINFLDPMVFMDADIVESASQAADDAKEELSKAQQMIQNIIPKLISFGRMIIVALLIYIVGKKVISWVVNLFNKALLKSKLEKGVVQFLTKLCSVCLYMLLITMIVGYLGLPTSSLVALVGSAGLAIGLALQGALANFAGGVLILIMKPFKVGDYIVTGGNEGKVTSIDVFYTRLTTFDNRIVVIPNGSITSASVQNYTGYGVRRVDLTVPMEYKDNFERVRKVLNQIAAEHELILNDDAHKPLIVIDKFDASSVNIGFKVWTKAENYWTVFWDMHRIIKAEFDNENISIPFEQLDVNLHVAENEDLNSIKK